MRKHKDKLPVKRKAIYRPPQLTVYGTIVELTHASGKLGLFDGAIGKMKGNLLKSSF